MRTVDRVAGLLESIGVAFALIGARALGLRGYPRMTVDYDLLTTDRRVLDRRIWTDLRESGLEVDVRKGDFDDPLAGVVRIGGPPAHEVDLVVGKWKWETGVVMRAELMDVGGLTIRVPPTSDLILLKLAAGGILDLQDVTALLALSDRAEVTAEVDAHIHDLDAEARATWERLRDQPADRGHSR